jgi:hypothetical protein
MISNISKGKENNYRYSIMKVEINWSHYTMETLAGRGGATPSLS